MKSTKLSVFLILIISCGASVASAQLQFSLVNRGVICREYHEDSHDIIDAESVHFIGLGEYSDGLELPVGDGILTSSQTTMVTNDDYSQGSLAGNLKVSILQPALNFPNGMDSDSYVEFIYYSPFTCDYNLSGLISGPGQLTLEINDYITGETISTETWTGGSFSTSGSLLPSTYTIHVELTDYVFGSELVGRNSECDFDLIMDPQMPVATDDMSFGAVKVLYR